MKRQWIFGGIFLSIGMAGASYGDSMAEVKERDLAIVLGADLTDPILREKLAHYYAAQTLTNFFDLMGIVHATGSLEAGSAGMPFLHPF